MVKCISISSRRSKKNGFKKLKGTVKFNQKKQLEVALKLGFVITGDLFKDGKPVGYDMEKILVD